MSTDNHTVQRLLDFEAANPKHTGTKETRIIDDLNLRPTRYYQLLHRAADTTEAMRHDPLTARTIRARRDRQQ